MGWGFVQWEGLPSGWGPGGRGLAGQGRVSRLMSVPGRAGPGGGAAADLPGAGRRGAGALPPAAQPGRQQPRLPAARLRLQDPHDEVGAAGGRGPRQGTLWHRTWRCRAARCHRVLLGAVLRGAAQCCAPWRYVAWCGLAWRCITARYTARFGVAVRGAVRHRTVAYAAVVPSTPWHSTVLYVAGLGVAQCGVVVPGALLSGAAVPGVAWHAVALRGGCGAVASVWVAPCPHPCPRLCLPCQA